MVSSGESVSISTSLPFDNKCICAFRSQSISSFDTKLWFCLINKKLSKTTPFVQVFRKKKRFGAKNAQNQRFCYINTIGMFLLWMSVFYIYTMKYSILSIFRAKQKMTLRPSRKHCSLLCVFVMKEYLLNCSSIRLDYDLLVFSSRFLLPKMKVFDIWKKELSNFHELLESARARASFENWFCVKSRVTAFTGKKNQVKRLLSRWSTTLFRCTCLYGHWIKVFFKDLEVLSLYIEFCLIVILMENSILSIFRANKS